MSKPEHSGDLAGVEEVGGVELDHGKILVDVRTQAEYRCVFVRQQGVQKPKGNRMTTFTDPNAVRRHLDVDVPAEVEAVADRLADPLFAAHVLAVLCQRCPEVVSAVCDDLDAA